jgi:hypothetical protein
LKNVLTKQLVVVSICLGDQFLNNQTKTIFNEDVCTLKEKPVNELNHVLLAIGFGKTRKRSTGNVRIPGATLGKWRILLYEKKHWWLWTVQHCGARNLSYDREVTMGTKIFPQCAIDLVQNFF